MKQLLHYRYFLCLVAIFGSSSLFSQNPEASSKKAPWKIVPFERKAFIENKGQFSHILPEQQQNFKYCVDKGQQVLFFPDGICYHITKYSKSREPLIRIFESEKKREERKLDIKVQEKYITVKWLGSNPNSHILVHNKQSTNYLYRTETADGKPATIACDGYSKLIYKDIYPGIDIEYVFHPENGLKYNILLQPGADISLVKMQYDQATKLSVKNGDIHISTPMGDIIDHAPVTFYKNGGEQIPSSFQVKDNVVSFLVAYHPNDEEVVIDPWTLVPGFTPTKAFDNGVDNNGNIYIYGGGGGTWVTEKYPPAGGAPIWSLPNLLTASTYSNMYYGDMLVEGSGDFYLAQSLDNDNGAHVQKFSPVGAPIWTSAASPSAMLEYWRMALNCVTGKVIVAGGGINYNVNIAQIDATTGALSNVQALQAPNDISGLCVDDAGNSYTHGAMPNSVSFNDANNNPIATASTGYSQTEAGNPYVPSNGYNMMALGGTSFLFTSDGATLIKWDKNTHAMISSVPIPGGQANLGSGILADKSNNLFVGASNGVYRFDFNLVQKEYQPTGTAVYDIAFAANGDIAACGDGFLQTLPFGREPFGGTTVQVTTDPCDAGINTVKVTPTQGVPPFTFLWDDGNTDSIRTNLSLGDHIVSIKDGSCTPSFIIDTITIGGSSNSLSINKTNPLCTYSSDGQITISLLSNQDITGITWTPAVTNALLNDSTSQATGLPSGAYSCFISSSLGCSFDTTITLIAQNPNPSANFLALQACEDQPIAFNDNSTSAIGNINAWSWNFGDSPANVTTQNTNHTYTDSGTFNATLIVTTAAGCRDTIQKQIIIHPLPLADFTFENVCEGAVAFFNDQSTVNPPDVVQIWTWDFGDGAPFKNNQNTSHLYPATGPYSVELTVTSNFGCKDSVTKTFTVNPVPVVSFTSADTNGCSIFCANMQSNVNLAGGNVAAYAWDYGVPGATGNTANGSYCYSNSTSNDAVPVQQEFDVSLTVTSDSGCVSTVSKNNYIVVYPNPIAEFNVDPQVVSIVNPGITITNTSHGESTWLWNFGDSLTDIISDPLPHVYADTGTYTIKLNIANQYGCLDSTTRVVI
ncbi:MAG: PKD domain-containing protein, partial [Bacteroidia bacterium]